MSPKSDVAVPLRLKADEPIFVCPSALVVTEASRFVPPTAPPKLVVPDPEVLTVSDRAATPSESTVDPNVTFPALRVALPVSVTAPVNVSALAVLTFAANDVASLTVRNSSLTPVPTLAPNVAFPVTARPSVSAVVPSSVETKLTVVAASVRSPVIVTALSKLIVEADVMLAPVVTPVKAVSLNVPSRLKVPVPIVRAPVDLPENDTLPPLAVVTVAAFARFSVETLRRSKTSPAAPLSRSTG